MKRISSLSFLAVLASAILPAQAQFKDYRFFEAATAPATLNDVTFDGTRFWAVGDTNGLLKSGSRADSPGVRGLIFDTVTLTGASNRLTSVVGIGAGNLAIGAGAGELTQSVGSLYRVSTNFAGASAALTTIPEAPKLSLGEVTDLIPAGTNLIRFGNRFAVGRYSLPLLNSGSPTPPERTADISPFFEDYRKGVLIGSQLILAGQYRGDIRPRGAVSLSRDFGLSNAPTSGVALFGADETPRIQTLGGDGQHLYVSGPSNFVAVLEGAATLTSLPDATNAFWKKSTNAAAGLTAIVPHAGVLFVAGADGIHQRSRGAAFLTSKEKPSNLTSPVQSLAVATTGDLEDVVVGVSGSKLLVGGPVPDPAVVGGYRLHFIDSDLSNVVNISNLITASTTSQRSVAYDIYKIVGGTKSLVTNVGPRRSSVLTSFNLVDFGTNIFNYGTNTFEVAARDVRTDIEGARIQFTAYRWPNPQAAHLGRLQGTDEPNHYFQLGADYATAPVPSFLFLTNQVINNGRGANLDVPVASANWFKLVTPQGQSIDGTNPLVLSNSLTAHELVATDVDRINLSALAPLDPGVHTFAVQSIAKFPALPGLGATNSYATNVTLFNVVVLRRPGKPLVDFVTWATAACVSNVQNNLQPVINGNWADAMLNPPTLDAARTDARFLANISSATWSHSPRVLPDIATDATSARLPLKQGLLVESIDGFQVQGISTNRDGGKAFSQALTDITIKTLPNPQPPGFDLTGVAVGTDGNPVPTNFQIRRTTTDPRIVTDLIQVGEGVVGNILVQPTESVQTIENKTTIFWNLRSSFNGGSSGSSSSSLFKVPFNLLTTGPGLHSLSAFSSNSFVNTRFTSDSSGAPTGTSTQTDPCISTSPSDASKTNFTALFVEVRQRPPVPAATVAGVGVYTDGSIQYVNPADSAVVVIGQDANRPQYSVTPGEIAGIGGTTWQTADWVLITAAGERTPLATNSATFTPPLALTTAVLGGGPSTNQILAYARSPHGSVGLEPRTMTLIVTPPPAAPALLAGGFSTYDGVGLVPQSDVAVEDNSTLIIASTLPEIADHRPTYSMVAQGTNALVADWYAKGAGVPLALGTTTFRPSTAQSPIGTNEFFAIARSTQGSQSAARTSFTLIVTGVPEKPALTANEVQRFNALGKFVSTDGVAVLPSIRVSDLVRDLVTEAGARLRPQFIMALQPNADGADWYRVGDPVRVATNAFNYRPSPGESPLGTNLYYAVARSKEGAVSEPTNFELVVTGPTLPPALKVGQFYLYQGGTTVRQDDVVLPANGSTTIADLLVEHPAVRRPGYALTGPSNAQTADWYQVFGTTTNLVWTNSMTFKPSVAQTPVGTHTFVAVARSAEGAISPVTTFTLIVTAVPSAPAIAAGDFLLPDAQGALTVRNDIVVVPATPVVVGDNAGDEARRRPQFSLSPLGVNVASADWYQVVAGVTNPVATNALLFRPTVASTPVGSHVFLAVARSTEGASSVTTRFTLTITGAPSEPEISGQIPKASADGLTLSNADGDQPVNAGDTFILGTKAAQQFAADGTFRFSVNDGVNLKAAFTRWSVNGTAVVTNQSIVPTLLTGTTNLISLTPYSQDGTAGPARLFTVIVTPTPAAPTVTPLTALRAACDTRATFTAQLAAAVRSIVWTAGPANDSTRLLVGAAYTSPFDEPVSAVSHKYYAWAVSENGDWSPAATVAELTVVPAPPAAGLADGRPVQAIALNAPSYPTLTVTNLGDNHVDWYLGEEKIGEGSPFTPLTNQLSTSLVGDITSTNKIVRTHVLRAVMSRENCTNQATTVTFLVTVPWLDASFTKSSGGTDALVTLHLNAAGDLTGKTVTLYTTNDLPLLVPEGDLSTKAVGLTPVVLAAPVSTNASGVGRYLIQGFTNLTESPGFYRVQFTP